MQTSYQPKWQKGLTFTIDALNIFNERTVTSINEEGEDRIGSVSPLYRQPQSFQNARKVRFTAAYEF